MLQHATRIPGDRTRLHPQKAHRSRLPTFQARVKPSGERAVRSPHALSEIPRPSSLPGVQGTAWRVREAPHAAFRNPNATSLLAGAGKQRCAAASGARDGMFQKPSEVRQGAPVSLETDLGSPVHRKSALEWVWMLSSYF